MEGTRQKTRDYHGSDLTDYGRSELVMGLRCLKQNYLHISPREYECVRRIPELQSLGQPLCIYGLRTRFVELSSRFVRVGGVCNGWCIYVQVVGLVGTPAQPWVWLVPTKLCILTLLLDKLPKWLSCQPFSQISWAQMVPRSKPYKEGEGDRWRRSCGGLGSWCWWWTRLKCLSPFFPRPWRWHKKRTRRSKTNAFHTGPGNATNPPNCLTLPVYSQ